MTHVSHHDQGRTGVGKTAIGVAGFRALESLKPREDRLIFDEFAIRIAEKHPLEQEFMNIFTKEKLDAMVNGLAVRTRKIDEEILSEIASAQQVVVVGAGLDFRPWRIHQYLLAPEKEENHSLLLSLSAKRWFEIDFEEIFLFKSQHLNKEEGGGGVEDESTTTSKFQYFPIVGNACTDNWAESLLKQGFDREGKTIWLLEGFTGYLTEQEVSGVFSIITELSAPGSKMISTFLGPNYKASLGMHRFKTSEPAEFLNRWKWRSVQHHFTQLMEEEYHRPSYGVWDDYYLVISYKERT